MLRKWQRKPDNELSEESSSSSEDFDPDDVAVPCSFQGAISVGVGGNGARPSTDQVLDSERHSLKYGAAQGSSRNLYPLYKPRESHSTVAGEALENVGSQESNYSLLKSDVSNMWCSEKTKLVATKEFGEEETEGGDDEDSEDDDLGVDVTYDSYWPAKLFIGERHPDLVVESTSLSSVLPPDIKYKLWLPQYIIKSKKLSALQLESVIYACQQHEYFLKNGERAGYLIGDGPGVGKGRTLAGIIYENYLRGRKKSLWISVSSDLMYDAERDLRDIGADIPVHPISKLKYKKTDVCEIKNGVLFSTYASLISSSKQDNQLSRLNQIADWCGEDFNGVIVFDECHRAKNLLGAHSRATKTGACVAELQTLLPKARVVYSSATGASEPKDMAYMSRLGLWGEETPFKDFQEFIDAVELRGIGAMEIVAMDMKLRGSYIARQLSFNGVKFSIENAFLTEENIAVYDESAKLWVEVCGAFKNAVDLLQIEGSLVWPKFWAAHQRFFKCLCIAFKVPMALKIARDCVKCGKCVVMALQSTGEARTLGQLDRGNGKLTDFVSTAKGILENLVEKHYPGVSAICSKAEQARRKDKLEKKRKKIKKREQMKKRVKRMSAMTISDSDSLDSDSSETSSESDSGSENTEPANYTTMNSISAGMDKNWIGQRLLKMKQELLVKINRLGKKLPYNTLDHIINELGGPDFVAELTGRKGRVILNDSGKISYETRAEDDESAEATNRIEKQRFLDGEKLFAIISEAASCGISLHSDRRFKNRRRRVHIILELPWSADRAIQQFGRTHRSNQVSCPEYVLLISDLAGENRFASIVAKRLESLGALTHGDRRATGPRDLSRFNVDNRFGRKALNSVMTFIAEKRSIAEPALSITIPHGYKGDSVSLVSDIRDALVGVGLLREAENLSTVDKERCSMTKFLNRILGMPVILQNALFQCFLSTLDEIMINAKKSRQFDMGILDLCESGFGGEVKCEKTAKFVRDHATGSGLIELHKLVVEKGMSWEAGMGKYEELVGKYAAYYLSSQSKAGKHMAFLVTADPNSTSSNSSTPQPKNSQSLYCLFKPNAGLLFRRVTLADISKKNRKVEPGVAEPHWRRQYEQSKNLCSHVLWKGSCLRQAGGGKLCETGLRRKTYHVLSGAVLSVWNEVEAVLGSHKDTAKMQIVRVKSGEQKFVGLLIPNCFVDELMKKVGKTKVVAPINQQDERDREQGRQSQTQSQTCNYGYNQPWHHYNP